MSKPQVSTHIPSRDLQLHVGGYKKHDALGEFFPLVMHQANVVTTRKEKKDNRKVIKSAMTEHKSMKKNSPLMFKQQNDDFVHTFVNSKITPNWGDNSRILFG